MAYANPRIGFARGQGFSFFWNGMGFAPRGSCMGDCWPRTFSSQSNRGVCSSERRFLFSGTPVFAPNHSGQAQNVQPARLSMRSATFPHYPLTRLELVVTRELSEV